MTPGDRTIAAVRPRTHVLRRMSSTPPILAEQGPAQDEAQDLGELFDVYEAPPDRLIGSVLPGTTVPRIDASVPPKARGDVHHDGDWHRSVHVWFVDSAGDLLLQRRSGGKDTHPGMLDVSCAGHVDAGDGVDETAEREVAEELSVDLGGGGEKGGV